MEKKNSGVLIFIIVLILLLFILGGFIFYNLSNKNNDVNQDEKNNQNEEIDYDEKSFDFILISDSVKQVRLGYSSKENKVYLAYLTNDDNLYILFNFDDISTSNLILKKVEAFDAIEGITTSNSNTSSSVLIIEKNDGNIYLYNVNTESALILTDEEKEEYLSLVDLESETVKQKNISKLDKYEIKLENGELYIKKNK